MIELARRVGHGLRPSETLSAALTHSSWCAEHGLEPDCSNERLEFLGDAVLGLAVTEHIYRAYPDLAEGDLAMLRASVVATEVLAGIARDLGVGDALRLGLGEEAQGGRTKPSLLGNALEAVIAAVHLDVGIDAARSVVIDLLAERIAEQAVLPGGEDHKTRLQELVALRSTAVPFYETTFEGPDHRRRYRSTVLVDGEPLGAGEGSSKKRAEQSAARDARARLTAEQSAARDARARLTAEQSAARDARARLTAGQSAARDARARLSAVQDAAPAGRPDHRARRSRA